MKDENGDLLADFHSILNNCKNYFSQVLNVHVFSEVRQIDIHTAEPIAPNPNPFDAEIAVDKLESYTSPGNDKIQAELIQVEGDHYGLRSINSLIPLAMWSK
jgi:hypothetical protein